MSESLVRRIRNHDQQAMSQLYAMHVGRLASVCYRYVPGDDDAKDVLQESFVKIFAALPTFEYRDEPSFRAWPSAPACTTPTCTPSSPSPSTTRPCATSTSTTWACPWA